MANQIESTTEPLDLTIDDVVSDDTSDLFQPNQSKELAQALPTPPVKAAANESLLEQTTHHSGGNDVDAIGAVKLLHAEVMDMRQNLRQFSPRSDHAPVEAYGLPNADLLLAGLADIGHEYAIIRNYGLQIHTKINLAKGE